MKIKVVNKTYQTIPLNFDDKVFYLKKRGKQGHLFVPYENNQIKNLKKKELIKVVYKK